MIIEDEREVMRDTGDGPIITHPALPPVHSMRQQTSNFVQAVTGVGTPSCDAAESQEDLRIARDSIRLWLLK